MLGREHLGKTPLLRDYYNIKIPLNPRDKTYEFGSNSVILTIASLYMGHEQVLLTSSPYELSSTSSSSMGTMCQPQMLIHGPSPHVYVHQNLTPHLCDAHLCVFQVYTPCPQL